MLLTGKKLLIFGFASTRSIAWGIALSAAKHGAELILCCANEKLAAKANLACTDANLKNTSIYTLDVSDEKLTQQVLQDIHQDHPAIDGIIHAIAYAPRELQGNTDNITAEGFMNSLNISVYSFKNIAKMAPSRCHMVKPCSHSPTSAPSRPCLDTTSWGLQKHHWSQVFAIWQWTLESTKLESTAFQAQSEHWPLQPLVTSEACWPFQRKTPHLLEKQPSLKLETVPYTSPPIFRGAQLVISFTSITATTPLAC